MSQLDPQHGPRISASLGGFVAVLAVVLLSPVPPAGAAVTPVVSERLPAPSVCDAPPAAPEQAIHRVTATTGGAVRVVHPSGVLPVLGPAPAARCANRPADVSHSAADSSGIPLRVLFCTWLN